QRLASVTTAVNSVANPDSLGTLAVRFTPVGLIPKEFLLCPVQQMRHLGDIRGIGWRGGQTMDDAAAIRADMGLHPKMPVFSFARLMHLRVACTVGILR